MKTLDYNDVKEFAADLTAKLDRCENGEGIECATTDALLECCAECCCKLVVEVRKWARDVFAGRVAEDSAVEQLWKTELTQLYQRAMKLLADGRQAEIPCFTLDGLGKLQAALFSVGYLLNGWVTPKLAVGPSARQELSEEVIEEARQRIAELPPLSADWQPDDQRQKIAFRLHRP